MALATVTMLVKNLARHIWNKKCEREYKIGGILVLIMIWVAIVHVLSITSRYLHFVDKNQRISLDLSAVEKVELESDAELTRVHNENCSYWDCFNVYRCGERLSIYVYPFYDYIDSTDGSSSLSILSREFFEILKIIVESPYYTSDPKEACILVPSIDTLNMKHIKPAAVAKALATLPFWEYGENHLLFNIVPPASDISELNTDRAIIAGADFDAWNFRTGFDFPISFLGYRRDISNPINMNNDRPIWLVASIINMTDTQRTTIFDIASKSNKPVVLLDKCSRSVVKRSKLGVRCAYGTAQTHYYPMTFGQSQFCLIAKTERLFQLNFIEALATNCIPVVFADNVVLPFAEIIDWSLAVVHIREADLHSIDLKLKSISPEKAGELREQGAWLYGEYFSTNKRVIDTMLTELNDRIYAYKAKTYFDWNLPTPRVTRNPLFLSRIAQKSQGFTAIILTYDRVESLFKLIQKLSVVSSLQKILVIWNNEKEAPPPLSLFPKIAKPLKVIRTKANKLSNRFYPYEEIETEAILTIDDDIVMLTADELDFGYEVWREFPDRIVGFPSRTHIWDNQTLLWRYESEWTNQISMVLTGAAFHHKYWSYAYTNEMPTEIKDWVDDHMNCEDIAMNFLVANFTKKPPIKVAPRKKFKCPECTHTEMLSADVNHMIERSACINRFAKVYGGMPLKTVEFRADPVLYKDNFPEKLKRFNDVGSL